MIIIVGHGTSIGRKDCIEVIVADETYVMPNLYVTIPPKPESEADQQVLAFMNLGTLGNRKSASYKFPSIFESASSILQNVEDDLRNGLSWFSSFNNPNDCLNFLRSRSPAAKLCRPGSPSFLYCEKYLEAQLSK